MSHKTKILKYSLYYLDLFALKDLEISQVSIYKMKELFCCKMCEYKTERKANFERHINSDKVHNKKIFTQVSNVTSINLSFFRIWTHKIDLCNAQLTDIYPIYEMKKNWSKNMIPVLRAIRYKLKPRMAIKTVKRRLLK